MSKNYINTVVWDSFQDIYGKIQDIPEDELMKSDYFKLLKLCSDIQDILIDNT